MTGEEFTPEDERAAASLKGYLSVLRQGTDAVQLSQIAEGEYRRRDADRKARFRTSKVECPYCRGPMLESMNQPSRIVRVLRRWEGAALAVLQEIPKTHRALGCQACHVVFTQPKRKGDR